MGVRIINGDNEAVLYCSTTDWAFGPVISSDKEHDATERAELFLEYLKLFGKDARDYSDIELESRYADWRMQEEQQWKDKERIEEE